MLALKRNSRIGKEHQSTQFEKGSLRPIHLALNNLDNVITSPLVKKYISSFEKKQRRYLLSSSFIFIL